MRVSVICPIYNGEKYIEVLFAKIRRQKRISKVQIIAPVSKSNDNSFFKAKKKSDIAYEVEEFNHGLTRHEAALKADGDYLVFITQDIQPCNEFWLYNLLKDLNADIVAAYSRQIAYENHDEIERLIREFNYPTSDRIASKENLLKNGRKNLFYSDSSSGILKNYYLKIDGYNFQTNTNEDVLLANKILKDNKKIKYASKSWVYHSHKFNFKNIYFRYKEIGKFERDNEKMFQGYPSENEGKKLCLFLIKKLIVRKKILELIKLPINIGTRYLGYKLGKKEKKC
ncbi:glycosyltransferase [Cetobacterium somerae]|uniref:glycosyltransferase n=1 Tax=Cetobacterium somerae TaxID=188913 RepID=UPI00211E9FC8|nr:glycosyltransferase [Cetobacterium somerae]MCQ9628124.1 glycosyltransferase [Cetobacterium somerae]